MKTTSEVFFIWCKLGVKFKVRCRVFELFDDIIALFARSAALYTFFDHIPKKCFSIHWIYVLKFHNWLLTISALPDSFIKSILLITTNPYFRLIGVSLIILLAGIGLFHFLSSHSLQSIFKKVDLKGIIGIELFGAEEDTYFDKYLNKVLCLFDAADADAMSLRISTDMM